MTTTRLLTAPTYAEAHRTTEGRYGVTERIQRSYELSSSPDDLLAALARRDVVQGRADADGLGTRVVTHEPSEDALRIVVSTDIPLDWLPSAITSRLGSSPTVQRMEEWTRHDGGLRTPLVFEFAGLPVTCRGDAVVSPTDRGSRMEADLTMRVDVPLFGGAVERAVAPRIVAALDAEAAYYETLSASGR
jgi:hypothetical protein